MEKHTEIPKVIPIEEVVQETPEVKTFYFGHSLNSQPGQFVMLWLPGVDEKPMSISSDSGDKFSLTICARGDVTKKISKFKKGEKLGIRGPYGTSFHFEEKEKLVMIGGGYGSAPLYYAAVEASKLNCKIDFINCARSKENLLYLGKLEKIPNLKVHFATDDGSIGHKGYGTDILEKLIRKQEAHRILTCGPELMMKLVGNLGDSKQINTQISVERYMKCGFGVCGQCVLDPLGMRACVSGPIMNYNVLKMLDEFGKYQRDDLGEKQYFS